MPRLERRTLAPLSLALALGVLPADAGVQNFRWDELQKQGRVAAGTVLSPESGSSEYRLKIDSIEPRPSSVTALTIDRPQIAGPRYKLTGKVRYDNVEGIGYLEMWNHFPGGGQYFSRTLAEQGPMMKLHGTSGWRTFVLPFDATGSPPPTRLVVNVVLQGRGTVYLGPMELSEETRASSGFLSDGVDQLAGVAGGVAGAVVGCVGAIIGVLTSLGRARRLVLASATLLIALGVLAFIVGIVAFASSHASFYPWLLLFGFLTSVLPLGLLPVIRKRYEDIELRAMRAHDLRA